jgi:hypothetical protein
VPVVGDVVPPINSIFQTFRRGRRGECVSVPVAKQSMEWLCLPSRERAASEPTAPCCRWGEGRGVVSQIHTSAAMLVSASLSLVASGVESRVMFLGLFFFCLHGIIQQHLALARCRIRASILAVRLREVYQAVCAKTNFCDIYITVGIFSKECSKNIHQGWPCLVYTYQY